MPGHFGLECVVLAYPPELEWQRLTSGREVLNREVAQPVSQGRLRSAHYRQPGACQRGYAEVGLTH